MNDLRREAIGTSSTCSSDRHSTISPYPFSLLRQLNRIRSSQSEESASGRSPHFLVVVLLLAGLLINSCGTEPVDPEGFTGVSGGCGEFMAYRYNEAKTEAIKVTVMADSFRIGPTPLVITLPDPALSVQILRFNRSGTSYFCDDVVESGEPKVTDTWDGRSGTVTLTRPDTTQTTGNDVYDVWISIDDVTLDSPDNPSVTVGHVEIEKVLVGWYPG